MTKPLVYFKKVVRVGGGFYINIPRVYVDSNDLQKKEVRLVIRDLKKIEIEVTDKVNNNGRTRKRKRIS